MMFLEHGTYSLMGETNNKQKPAMFISKETTIECGERERIMGCTFRVQGVVQR